MSEPEKPDKEPTEEERAAEPEQAGTAADEAGKEASAADHAGKEPSPADEAGTGDEETEGGFDDEEVDSEIRNMLRGAMQRREKEEEPPPDVLRGVQRRLRERSRGKFYADGWSTARHPPISMFLLTSLLMLAILFIAYAVLSPTAGEPVHVKMAPAPVHVLPPQRH